MNVDTLAKIIWEYHLMHQQLEKADGIIVPGSHNIMVGDLQRIMIYPEKGWQIAQSVPPEVAEAFTALVGMGYTRRLIQPEIEGRT